MRRHDHVLQQFPQTRLDRAFVSRFDVEVVRDRIDVAVADHRERFHGCDHGPDPGEINRAAKALLPGPAMHKNGRHTDVLQRACQIGRG